MVGVFQESWDYFRLISLNQFRFYNYLNITELRESPVTIMSATKVNEPIEKTCIRDGRLCMTKTTEVS